MVVLDAVTIYESFSQNAAYSLESVDASYPNKVSDQEDESLLEKQTYSEKRKFWEDITRNRDSYQRSESEVSRTSQLIFNESDSEYMQNIFSEEDTAATSARSETMEDLNIPDISECSVAEKAHYFEEQIQKEMLIAKGPFKSQNSLKERDKSNGPGGSGQGALDLKLEKSDLKLELKLAKTNVEELDRSSQKININNSEFPNKLKKKPSLEENEEIFAKFEEQGTPDESLIESEKKHEESLKKKLQRTGMFVKKEEMSEVSRKKVERSKTLEKKLNDGFEAESEIPVKMLGQEDFGNEVDFDGKMVKKRTPKTQAKISEKEKIKKGSMSIPETNEMQKSIKKQENEFMPIKKEFESRIPVSVSKIEKEKSEKLKEETKEVSKDKSLEAKGKFETSIDPEKKKEFESRIPKRVQEKKEPEKEKNYICNEEKIREEITSLKKKSETQTFSTIGITSKIDHETSTTLEKKEMKSSEISKGGDKFLLEEKREHVEQKKISELILKKQYPDDITDERESRILETDKTAFEKTSISLTADKQVINASTSQAMIQRKETQKSKLFEDKAKIITEVKDASKIEESKVDVGIKIERDLLHSKEDIVNVSSNKNIRKSKSKSVEAQSTFKGVNPSHDQPATTFEARNIAETLVQSIENELEKKTISSDSLKKEVEDLEPLESTHIKSEVSDDQLADDLMRKFENIMRKSIDKEDIESVLSIQEDLFEMDCTEDSVSVSADLTKDKDSYPQEKKILSSSRLHETTSLNSISDHIDSEDIEVKIAEVDLLKSKKLSESEKPPLEYQVVLASEAKDQQKYHIIQEGTVYSEIPGTRVLEILEPECESQSGQDSMDISSLEIDDFRISELKDLEDIKDEEGVKILEDINNDKNVKEIKYMEDVNVTSIHECTAMDSLAKICQEEGRDIIMSPSTVSEETNIDFSLPSELTPIRSYTEGGMMSRKGDSFEIHSPPMISPRSKVKDLEIKPINWMIGDEKIEISETLQPCQAFDKELEEYQSTIKQRSMTMSLHDEEINFVPESRIESKDSISKSTIDKKTPKDLPIPIKSKFRVTKISDLELEKELKEDKLEASCQELIDSLEKERKEETLFGDFSHEMSREERFEISKYEGKGNFMKENQESNILDFLQGKEKLSELKEPLQDANSLFSEDIQTELIKDSFRIYQDSKSRGKDDFDKDRSYSEDHKKVMEQGEKPIHSDHSAFKIKKDDSQNVDLSARYAKEVLDQVVNKEIAEVKESLEAAKQDLIDELSEHSETVFQIEDSPSEFQFKLQPESIPNELPFLYKAPSSEKSSDHDSTPASGSPIIKPRGKDTANDPENTSETSTFDKKDSSLKSEETSWDFRGEKSSNEILGETEKPGTDRNASLEENYSSSPVPASRSSSEMDNKNDSFSLQPPQPAPRRRPKPVRISKKVISESEPESSGESNYQSCEYEVGSGSRPSSSDFEALQSALSGTASEYETALMSIDHTSSHPTSRVYRTAANTMSSRESVRSPNSLSSGHLGSIDNTSEFSETLVASDPEVDDKDVIDENFETALDDEPLIVSELDSREFSSAVLVTIADTLESEVPCRMKRSSEMIFQQLSGEAVIEKKNLSEEQMEKNLEKELEQNMVDRIEKQLNEKTVDDKIERKTNNVKNLLEVEIKSSDSSTSTKQVKPGAVESVNMMTARINKDGIQNVSTQVIFLETTSAREDVDKHAASSEPGYLDQRLSFTGIDNENLETMQKSARSWLQQASMSTSSASGLSLETVVEKDLQGRYSPDSDSFELVDKPDFIDDFVVIEEVGREAEEFDSEGKSIRISSISQSTMINFDRDVENLITEKKDESEVATGKVSTNSELFEFESEESPPQASNDDQYSQSYLDEEQYEGGKKWIEIQFQGDARLYDIEYERGPLEDIKEEEITDFEAGSSRFGSIGSHKESIGSIGSMRGSFGSTPDYDTLMSRKYLTKPTDHDNVSLSSLQEFEHLENAVALENSKKFSSGSQDSGSNGSLPRRYASRSGHGDDVSLSSLKDFEGLERACKEAHLIELRAKEEENLLDHESPENKFKLENLSKAKADVSATGSVNQSNSGSDDYEKRIKEIDEIIRISQVNVEKLERQDDTTEDVSQIEAEKVVEVASTNADVVQAFQEANIMETSTDSLELVGNADEKYDQLCRSSDSLELKTTIDFPSLSSDSLNNVRNTKDVIVDVADLYHGERRISSDSLEIPAYVLLDSEIQLQNSGSNSNRPEESAIDRSLIQSSLMSSSGKTKSGSTSRI